MIVRGFTGAMAALLMACAPMTASAQTVEWPQAAAVSPEWRDQYEAYAVEAVGWANLHQALSIEAFRWLGTINQGVNLALGGSPTESQWGPGWARGRRAGLADLMARHAALPPPPEPPEAPVNLPSDALTEFNDMARFISSTSERSRFMLDELGGLAEPTLELAESPNPDRNRLARAYYALNIGMLQAENENIAISSEQNFQGHPNQAIAQSSIAMNLAMVEYMHWQEASRFNESTDAEARAGRIDEQAANMRASAEDVRSLAAAMAWMIEAEVQQLGASAYAQSITAALGTYEDSARVEERIAGSLGAVAVAMRAGDNLAVERNIQAVLGFTGQRLQLDMRRRELAAGG